MFTGLWHHGALHVVRVAEPAQRTGRLGRSGGHDIGRWFGKRRSRNGRADGAGRGGHRKPSRDVAVKGTILGDECGRIPLRVGVGVTTEEPFDGLRLRSGAGRDITVDIDECAEQLRILHSEVDRAGAAGGPADHRPVRRVIAHPEGVDHERHNVLGEMVRGVTPRAVHASGVIVERADGVDEDEHRGVAIVRGRELVDGRDGVSGTQPIGCGVELTADHHDRGKCGRWIAGEVGRRQIHPFGAVREPRCVGGDGDRQHRALGRHGIGRQHPGDGGTVGLARKRPASQLTPCGLDGGEVTHPQVQHQRRAQHRQRHRQHRGATSPPVRGTPAEHRHPDGEPGQRQPGPESGGSRITGESVRSDIPIGRQRHQDAHQSRNRQPYPSPPGGTPPDREDQQRHGHDLDGDRYPSLHQRYMQVHVFQVSAAWPAGTAASP